MNTEKSTLFSEFDLNNNLVSDQSKTEYQIGIIMNIDSVSKDYYEINETKYYRQNIETIKDENKDYTMNYVSGTPEIINGICVVPLVTIPKSSQEIEQTLLKKWEEVRNERDKFLKKSDETSMIYLPDVWSSKPELEKQAWLDYRQQLRDLPQTFTNPFEVVWPELPVT